MTVVCHYALFSSPFAVRLPVMSLTRNKFTKYTDEVANIKFLLG